MKHFLILILALVFAAQGFATPQVGDRLIYKGDTLRVYLYLPDEFWETETTSTKYVNRYISPVKLFGNKKLCNISSCYAYQATWEIIENQLYLTGIYSCCYREDSIKADLASLFGEKCMDGKVKADWITGNFTSYQGKRLLYDHGMGNGGIFEYELELHFEKGLLTGTQLYDNRKAKQSVYSQNDLKLMEYIYSNIIWVMLPQLGNDVKVVIKFSANENGIIDSVTVLRGYNKIYDQEAIRVIKSIPEWDVYYEKGKHVRRLWYMPIVFSEENRLKYKK